MDVPDRSLLAVVLAAGGGTRFHGPHHKLLAPMAAETADAAADTTAAASDASRSEPVAAVAIRRALDARIGPVLVVTGAADLADVIAAIRQRPGEDGDGSALLAVHNARWADGQATSLHVAVTEAERMGVEAIVVGLADQPFVDPEAWRRVAAADAPIAIATYDGARRNPVRLHRSVWPLLPTTGDEGARSITRLHPELVQEIPCPGSPADIDTLEDLESWQNRSSTNSP